MNTFAGFLGALVASLMDPIALIGYGLAGALSKKYFWAIGIGIGWAILVGLLVQAMNEHASFGRFLPVRIVGAILVTSIVFAIAQLIRKSARSADGKK